MAKVEAHGIRGNYSRWIRNWLTGRTQRVVIHDETSDLALVTSGVPQGNVLGRLLFIIYINDLDVGIISKINKFADDTKLCHRAFTERDRATIQSDLNLLLQWTETWQMSFNIEKCSEILSDGVFTVEEVEEQLSILNPYKSTGPDGLGPRILKETAEVISEPLSDIFNRSLETGIVPDDWKRANVTPIFKKGNRQIPNNYRPISLTSVISKTIERLLKVRITKHLNDQNLINDTQHGFREQRSCLTNLLDFFGEVNRIYESTKAVDLVYLDFQKAFDKVPHERLMAKVEAHGIRGNYSRCI
ncbi:Reverse transcriptase domain [Trinorchestia longiramus]|nr:Reverse transcriptase domain [Trinorchestia longiramus]